MKLSLRLLGLGQGGGVVSRVVEAVEGCTVSGLVGTLPEEVRGQMQQARILLTVNGRRVDREQWDAWRLQEGDTVAILQALAGG